MALVKNHLDFQLYRFLLMGNESQTIYRWEEITTGCYCLGNIMEISAPKSARKCILKHHPGWYAIAWLERVTSEWTITNLCFSCHEELNSDILVASRIALAMSARISRLLEAILGEHWLKSRWKPVKENVLPYNGLSAQYYLWVYGNIMVLERRIHLSSWCFSWNCLL